MALPAAPQAVTVRVPAPQQLAVDVTLGADTGSPIVRTTCKAREDNAVVDTRDAPNSTVVFLDVQAGVSYTFCCSASNAAGSGPTVCAPAATRAVLRRPAPAIACVLGLESALEVRVDDLAPAGDGSYDVLDHFVCSARKRFTQEWSGSARIGSVGESSAWVRIPNLDTRVAYTIHV